MKTLLFMGLVLIPFLVGAQRQSDQPEDYEKVKQAVIAWADTTFKDYNEPRFEHFRANYTDEYLIASMRVKSIDRSIRNLKKSHSSGYYKGTEDAYQKSIEDLEVRKEEAVLNSVDFQPKVDSFQVSFWANIKLDSGLYNYIKHDILLDNDFKVIQTTISGRIGENKNAKIIYR